MKSASKV